MKNKRLITIVAVVLLFLVGNFIVEKVNQAESKGDAEKEVPTVGVLQFVSHPALDTIYQGTVDALEDRGYKDGETVTIEFQNGQADQSKLATMSQQLIDKGSDVLVGIATPAAQALANTTKDIPIVLGAISDPESAGLVESNEQPGENITGVSDKSPVGAQFELVQTLLPEAKRVGILFSSAEDNSDYQAEQVKIEGEKLGFDVTLYSVPSTNEITQMVQVMSGEVDLIYIPTDNTIANAMQTVVDTANKTKTPVIPSVDTMVEQGGLATVGINQYDLGYQTGQMVADILDGTSDPATTPIFTFEDGDVIINEEQAAFLGITIPDAVKTSLNQKKNADAPKENVTIGILQTTSHVSLDDIKEGVLEGLKENGYAADTGDVNILVENGQGNQNNLHTMATHLVQEGADILIGVATPACQALANATSDIPIVMAAVADPVKSGLTESEEKPNTNVTGVKNQAPVEKQLKLAQELLPKVKTVGLLYSSGEDNARTEAARTHKIAEKLGLTTKDYPVTSTNDIPQMMQQMKGEVDVIYLPIDNTIATAMDTVVAEANKLELPVVPTVELMVEQGGIATVSISQTAIGVKAGEMAADILTNDTKPQTTPVYALEDGDVVYNKTQLKKLGIPLPSTVAKKGKDVSR